MEGVTDSLHFLRSLHRIRPLTTYTLRFVTAAETYPVKAV